MYRASGRRTFATDPSKRGRYLRFVGTMETLMAWADTEIEVPSPPETKTDPQAAPRLKLPSDEGSVTVVRRFYQGVTFVMTRVYPSPEAGELLRDEGPTLARSETVLGTLKRVVLRCPVVEVSQGITAVLAPPDVSE